MDNNENKTPQTPVASLVPNIQNNGSKSSLGIPVAIVLAAALIAAAIVFTGSQKSPIPTQIVGNGETAQQTPEVEIAPVSKMDHVRGDPNAPIVIIEYSDFECPFCKNFHETMNKVMAEYGKSGKVAWVYRSYPIVQLHPNAPKIAEAAECVASLGGNDAFWKFSDLVFGERGMNEPTNISKLPEFAATAGVNKDKFNSCLTAGTFKDTVQKSIEASVKAGAQGTPYSILMAGNQQGPINGAQPYETVKGMIDTVLSQLEAKN